MINTIPNIYKPKSYNLIMAKKRVSITLDDDVSQALIFISKETLVKISTFVNNKLRNIPEIKKRLKKNGK